ncbi:MAG: hypothetical protein OEZ58_09215 [Gammaproteobacteria bacterium]|nr:hypothetical protein [Gammaproteobacteria bacterium]MDH5729156.1 hypothetical protein [Gammaproteobacteria bacterium]
MQNDIIELLKTTLALYRRDAINTSNSEDREELMNIVATAEALLEALKSGNVDDISDKALGFSRNVSDAYCVQPPSYRALAECVKRIKTEIV